MNTLTRGIIAAGAVSLAASLVVPGQAHAATTEGMPSYCYQWPSEPIRLLESADSGAGMRSDTIMVTDGSPCRDINVKAVTGPDGTGQCRDLRVRWTEWPYATGPWRHVCSTWRVLAYGAVEGRTYTIESSGGPAVQVRVRG